MIVICFNIGGPRVGLNFSCIWTILLYILTFLVSYEIFSYFLMFSLLGGI